MFIRVHYSIIPNVPRETLKFVFTFIIFIIKYIVSRETYDAFLTIDKRLCLFYVMFHVEHSN